MYSSLNHPDLPTWHDLPDYSPLAAACLVRAYARIAGGGDQVAPYLRAANEVIPCLAKPIATPQRLRVLYVAARAYAADGQGEQALNWTDGAIDLALNLDDWSALVALLYLRGALNGMLLRCFEGAADYEESRSLLRERAAEGEPRDFAFDLHLTVLQANLCYFTGKYAAAEVLLEEARGLVPLCPSEERERATIAWVEANLFRLRGSPELALRPALAAAEVFTKDGPANSAARIQILAAEVSLDLASTLSEGSDRNALIGLARPHISKALQLVDGTNDVPAEILARLAEVRSLRLEGADVPRLVMLETQLPAVRSLGDNALLGQVYTAMGDEVASQGELEAARSCYRQALQVLDRTELQSLGTWARRALYRPGSAGKDHEP
jgi:tetratricopeptide (TPR) repeat protein